MERWCWHFFGNFTLPYLSIDAFLPPFHAQSLTCVQQKIPYVVASI